MVGCVQGRWRKAGRYCVSVLWGSGFFCFFCCCFFVFFFFNDTATTEIYTLSLHDALPICGGPGECDGRDGDFDAT